VQAFTPVMKPDRQADGEYNDEDFDEDLFQLVQPIFFGILLISRRSQLTLDLVSLLPAGFCYL